MILPLPRHLLAAGMLLLLAPGAPRLVFAQEGQGVRAAREAVQTLRAAHDALNAAQDASDQVIALTGAVRGYEAGLDAVRAGLRRVAREEAALSEMLAADEDNIAALLNTLQNIGRAPEPALLTHPGGAASGARALMLVEGVLPGLEARAGQLRKQISTLRSLRGAHAEARAQLQEGLRQAEAARTSLAQALVERRDLPRRFEADPIRTALLIASTDTLEDFISGLSRISTDGIAPLPPAPLSAPAGSWALPVAGKVRRMSGEADASGVVRPGIVVETAPGALVVAPWDATLRYKGELLGFGLVSVLEPQRDHLVILAGLEVAYGEIGEILPAGSPVGIMGASPSGEGAGVQRSQTLYIETRQGTEPVNPASWFDMR